MPIAGAHHKPLTGVHFIQLLLDINPETRMTLSDAMEHPWLARCRTGVATKRERTATPPLRRSQDMPRDYSMMSAKLDADDPSMLVSMPEMPSSQSTGCKVPGAYPSNSQDPARVLQRRRKIIDDARDNGISTLEPTPEMIQNAQREDGDTRVGSRPLKRKAADDFNSSLSPMSEEDDDSAMAGSDEAGPSKRGKAVDGAIAIPSKRGPRAGRRGKLVTPPVGDAEDSPQVRRSHRLGAQNGARVAQG